VKTQPPRPTKADIEDMFVTLLQDASTDLTISWEAGWFTIEGAYITDGLHPLVSKFVVRSKTLLGALHEAHKARVE